MRLGALIAERYRLVKGPIRGGTGEVWLAEDTRLPRTVVLKRAASRDDGSGAFDRLWSEARAQARFDHPHVVTLHDIVEEETGGRVTSWLVLEHVPGGSLDDWPPMSPQAAAGVGAQIAEALAALHTQGIVHCDVKPGNIVVTAARMAKLADFGAAYRLGGTDTITPNGPVSHTPAFAAPEVVRGHPEPASDVYSLGATVYALTVGEPPGAEPGYDALGPLGGVLEALTRLAPDERPGADEARRMLDEVAGTEQPELPGHSTPTDNDGPSTEQGRGTGWGRPAAFVRRHPRPVAAAAFAVAAAAVAVAVVIPSGGDEAPARPKPASLIGDPRTADPCALADAAALGRFGEADLDNDYGNFDRCDVLVSVGENDVIDVRIGMATGSVPETGGGPARTIGRVRVIPEAPEEGECGRMLVLPPPDGGTTISIDARQTEEPRAGAAPAPLCAIADTAVASAVAVLNRGPVPRRTPPFPPQSLAHKDACTMLGNDALDVVPGIDAGDPEIDYGAWACEWHSTTRDIQVKLRFDRGQPLGAEDGSPTRLGGRRAFVEPDAEGDGTCLVRVVHRTYADQNGDDAIEMLYLVVQGDPPTDRLCSMATSLAGAAATQLPAA
ncbi:serine/threonine protein kinase [Actinomadura sp. KC06]|uniref:serine/threonine-protein kinase n=1 Tax=Actinomadura sp. KC06 TaxID=2530369 RepID=UPI001047981D|nr:serine/threonine-protein kinase [Actinomadura sp. KC06]TDD29278.1 serine/threonine protein kinase [Actinomadura sp. KC06]